MHKCLFACLPVCLLACLPVYLLACLLACLPACLLACLPTCLLAYAQLHLSIHIFLYPWTREWWCHTRLDLSIPFNSDTSLLPFLGKGQIPQPDLPSCILTTICPTCSATPFDLGRVKIQKSSQIH